MSPDVVAAQVEQAWVEREQQDVGHVLADLDDEGADVHAKTTMFERK